MTRRSGDEGELPQPIQFIISLFIIGILIKAFFGEAIINFWNQYWILIVTIIILIVIGGILFYVKIILPIDEEIKERLRKEEELKKNIIRKRLLKKKAKQLKGLTKEEREFLLNEWVEKEYNKEMGYDNIDVEKVPPLSEREKGKLIHAVGDECENPKCKHKFRLQVHHIVPRHQGGTNKLKNLLVLCPTCHNLADSGAFSKGQLKAWASRRGRFKYNLKWRW